jgi:hypothetical protein
VVNLIESRPYHAQLTAVSFPPGLLCELLDSAYRIQLLTHACVQHYLERFNQLRPKLDCHVSSYDQGGQVDYGPPTLTEELRVARGFWNIQMFYDLMDSQSLLKRWSEEDIDDLCNKDFGDHFKPQLPESEEVRSVMEYSS